MLRVVLSKKLICAAFFPFSSISNQVLDEKQPKTTPHRFYMEKFKDIWDENGHLSKELQFVINATTGGIITGYVFGGLVNAKPIAESFKKENQATLFENTFQAHKRLHMKICENFMKESFRWATKLGLFCFIFSSASTAIHVYRNKFDILNHICSGAITGFLLKINMGMKGIFSGTIVGAMLGTISGIITVSLLWVTGYDLNNIYEFDNKTAKTKQE